MFDPKDFESAIKLANAVLANHFPDVVEAIANGANPNLICDQDGASLLHLALSHQNHPILKALIRAGADLEARFDGLTPLAVALTIGDHESMQFLLAAGADPNAYIHEECPNLLDGAICLSDFKAAVILAEASGLDLDSTYRSRRLIDHFLDDPTAQHLQANSITEAQSLIDRLRKAP